MENNPLSRVDPSGYGFLSKLWKGVKKWVKPIVAAVVAYYTFGWTAIMTSGNLFAAGALSGFVGGAIATGTFKGALSGAVIGGITGGLASAFSSSVRAGEIAAGALSNAASTRASGGRWQDGYLSGGFSTFATPSIGTISDNFVGRTVAAAVVGGTTSVIGGGKFENGARTAGFLRLFGEAADYYQRAVERAASLRPGENRPAQTTYEPDAITGRQPPGTERLNIVGNNDLSSFCRQGSVCSKALNVVPLIAPTSGLHDYWFNVPGHLEQTFINNVGTMLPAAAISTGAVLGNLTQG